MSNARYESLDTVRGFAVMGILLMNIVAFAMPSMAYINPLAWGTPTTVDLATWAVNFVLVDGKMRGLFSLLFGASMLLVIERADAADQNGRRVHLWRMAWLLVFGLVHFYLIWFGDILTLYALCGFVAVLLVHKPTDRLIRWAIGLFVVNFVVWAVVMGGAYVFQHMASQPGADADMVKSFAEMRDALGAVASKETALELAAYTGSYADAVAHRAKDGLGGPLFMVMTGLLETVGLMALGMAMFRNGFLRGEWEGARYRAAMVRAYVIGIPPLVVLAAFCWARGFDVLDTATVMFVATMPFRLAVTIGHAALLVLLIQRLAGSPLLARVAAAGRAAFSNYLGTSILMTLLFYGYGGGLFGEMSRWQIYLVPPLVWVLMLLWSKPWLDRYRYGPLEWLWRSLSRGRLQPMRR